MQIAHSNNTQLDRFSHYLLCELHSDPLSGRKAANSVIFVPFMLLNTTKLNISIVDSLIFIVQVFCDYVDRAED